MYITTDLNCIAQRRKNERGAALLTTLFISMLLLAAGGALIASTSMTTANTYDSTAEAQAYYAAESGLQETLNTLRKHTTSINPAGVTIDFRKAVTADPTHATYTASQTSNASDDPSTVARLSNWLPYSPRTNATSRVVVDNGAAYSVTITDPDATPAGSLPSRLLVISKGYGPKGAVKQLQLVVSRSAFAFNAPSTITMVGAADPLADPMHITLGQSNAKDYSGHDNATGSTVIKPAFGTTSASDQSLVLSADTKDTVAGPIKADDISASLPSWLQSADAARGFLNEMQSLANSQGRLFQNSFSGTSGSTSNPAFTFVNGDCSLDGGAGLLIVTGNLALNGNPSFDGIILVLGEGTVNRGGGGNGDIFGAMVVAQFARTWPATDTGPHPFTSPWFDTDGGGTSNMQYDSDAVNKALNTVGSRPIGILEY